MDEFDTPNPGNWRVTAERAGHPTLEFAASFDTRPTEEYMAQRLLAMVYAAEKEPLFKVEPEVLSGLRLAGFGYAMSPLERVGDKA